jgi:SET domain-containing protein
MPRLSILAPLPEAAPSTAQARQRGRPADPQKFVLRVGESTIDGQGVFAGEAIPARRKIGEVRGEAISVQEAQRRSRGQVRIMLIAVSERRALDATQSADALRFINHSCRPNAALRLNQGRVEFYAMRDIAVGEELTVNYGETHHQGRLRCRCGVAGCAGLL